LQQQAQGVVLRGVGTFVLAEDEALVSVELGELGVLGVLLLLEES